MDFGCPNCGHKVDLSKTVCRRCGQRLSLGAVLLFYAQRARARWRRVAAIRCPDCGRKVPLSAKTCPRCGVAISVQLAVQTTLVRPRRWWRRAVDFFSPQTKQWIWRGFKLLTQLAYLAGSGVLFARQFLTFQVGDLGWMLLRMALTALFLATLTLLALWIVPRPLRLALTSRTAPLVRAALVLNLLTLVVWLQMSMLGWWGPALVLAGLVVILCAAAFLLAHVLWPRVTEVRRVFQEAEPGPFDASQPQGRNARHE